MPYIVQFEDRLDAEDLRKQHRPAHVAHIKSYLDRIITAGPVENDQGQLTGGFIVLDIDDGDEALRFALDDPYTDHGIHTSYKVLKYNQSFRDGKFLG